MECTIIWNGLGLDQWNAHFAKVPRSTLLQSYGYARAVAPIYGQRPCWGLIKIDGKDAGIVQMMEARMFGRALHAMTIDRGPLWFENFGNAVHVKLFFDEINRQFPKRFGRKRRLIPELPSSPSALGILKQAGLVPSGPDYTTSWLDLTKPLETLRAGLKSNWRNHLNKAERGPLKVEWDKGAESLSWLVGGYELDQAAKQYPGPAPKIVRALGKTFAENGNCLLGRATLDNRPVSSILVLCHGNSATYQIGWSDTDGRAHGGHYRLLWSCLEELKNKGIAHFDLGGIHDEKAEGVSAFKDGMGGQRVTLCGLYS